VYIDRSYLEFAGPECASVKDALAYEKAGERIVWLLAKKYLSPVLVDWNLLKSSCDTRDSDWTKSCHENYLIPKQLFRYLMTQAQPITSWYLAFLATRPIIAGAGRIYLGRERQLFSISQRAHLITSTVGTTAHQNRNLINLKDENYASPEWSRLHVIAGDLNRCDWSIFLKLGTTAILLEFLIEMILNESARREEYVRQLRHVNVNNIAKAHEAVYLVSRDLSTKSIIPQFEGPAKTPWHMQDLFCDVLTSWYESYRKNRYGPNSEYELVFAKWREVLDKLFHDPRELSGILDWPTRFVAVESILEDYGVSWQEVEQGLVQGEALEALDAFDHSYSSLNPKTSVFNNALAAGAIERLVTENEISRAMLYPPRRTRAFARGHAVRMLLEYFNGGKRPTAIDAVPYVYSVSKPTNMDWNKIALTAGGRKFETEIPDPRNEYKGELQMLKDFIIMLPKEVIRQ
jgi:proteasome accessory factor A